MQKSYLEMVITKLEELRVNLFLAERTMDNRRRCKSIRETKRAIADYAHNLPSEVLGYLDTTVDVNALNYQWVESDIDRCIKALQDWRDSLPE